MMQFIKASTLVEKLKDYIEEYGDLPVLMADSHSSNALDPIIGITGLTARDTNTNETQNVFAISDYIIDTKVIEGWNNNK